MRRYIFVIVLTACAGDRVAPVAADVVPIADASAPALIVSPSPSPSPPPSARVPTFARGECGKKPLPDCPLQEWMKTHMTGIMRRDLQALAQALDDVVAFAPAGYTDWRTIAESGATAARNDDFDAVKAACRACHNKYQAKYREEMRERALWK